MKLSVDDLAIFGGTPAFGEKLHIGTPNIGNRESLNTRINELLDRKWFTNQGPFVNELEKNIADLLGVKHCIAMCNGTIALEIVIRALGISGEVIVPSFTFIATAHALQWQEITPVFCDIDPSTHCIDPAKIEAMITPRTTGILGVHIWGKSCSIEDLITIAEKHKLKLFFDASHAFSCSYKGKMIGNFGDAEVFSFHATKFFNTFEGGAVATNSDKLAEKIRLMKNFGFWGYDNVIYIGTNGKMSEISAAMGLTGLESLEEFIKVNQRNYIQYAKELNDIPGIKLLTYNEKEKNNYQYIVIEVDSSISKVSRDQLQQILWAENILVRRYFYPGCHRMEPYRSHFPNAGMILQNTELLAEQVLSLPTGTSINPDSIKKICQIIRYIISNKDEVREKLLNHSVQPINPV
jgi:dTDP-4-amino-4,6-dideoxygalactose transaminase